MNRLVLKDKTQLEYTLGGAVSMIGDMYIDIPNITIQKAVEIFSDVAKTEHMEFWSGDTVTAFEGFTTLAGVETPYDQENLTRITLRKSFGATEKALTVAKSEAAQYKAALELLGISTQEVS